MSDSKQKQLQLNQRTLDANNKLKDITRTANATVEIMDNTNRVLDDQGQKIQRNIELVLFYATQNDEIKNNLMITKKKTEEMRRRNLCIKISMYVAILALFAANVVSIIVKVSGKTGTKT